MKVLKPILVFSGLSIIGYALYKYYIKQVQFLRDITYQVTGVKAVSVSEDYVSLEVKATIFNASNVEATIKEMYLDVFINDIKVAQVNEVKDILIVATGSANIDFNFSFSPKKVGQNLLSLIFSTASSKGLKINIDGYVKVKSSFIQTTVPFTYEKTITNLFKK